MIDLTKNNKEKETYIVDLQTLEDTEQIKVTFANGEKFLCPFSVHNLQVNISRMENQYFTYGSNFEELVRTEDILFLTALLRDISFTIIWFVNIIQNPENISYKLCLALCLTFQFLLDIPLVRRLRKLHLKKKKLDIMKKFMENKDLYTIFLEHPVTNEEVKLPIIHLGNIDQFSTMESFDHFTKNLTEEEKEKQKEKAQQFLLKLSEKKIEQ